MAKYRYGGWGFFAEICHVTQALKPIFVLFGNKIVFLSNVHLHQPFLSKTCLTGFVSLIITNIVDTVVLIFIIKICISVLFVVILKGVLG